jgi:hypothetical protein
MPLTAYVPKDLERYKRHPGTVPFSVELPAGSYVFVQDVFGEVWLAPDGSHVHPKILGRVQPAVAAGELTLLANGEVASINNLSGTFQCPPDSLLVAIGGLIKQGAAVRPDAVSEYEV